MYVRVVLLMAPRFNDTYVCLAGATLPVIIVLARIATEQVHTFWQPAQQAAGSHFPKLTISCTAHPIKSVIVLNRLPKVRLKNLAVTETRLRGQDRLMTEFS